MRSSPLKKTDIKDTGILWMPREHHVSNMQRFADYVADKRGIEFLDYTALHAWSVDHLGQFVNDAWDFLGLIGDKGGTDEKLIRFTDDAPFMDVMPNAQFNIAQNIIAGIEKDLSKPAVISKRQDQPQKTLTGQELINRVSLWQQALVRAGIKKGDHIGLSTTNEAEFDTVLLAASSMGAALMPVGIGMGTDMMIKRFLTAEPKLLIAGDGTREYGVKEETEVLRVDIINAVRKAVPSIQHTVVAPTLDCQEARIDGFDDAVSMDEFLSGLTPTEIKYADLRGNSSYVVYASSGSTGVPKVFDHGALGVFIKNLTDHVLHNDMTAQDVYFQHSKQEWMMWPYQHVALASGATLLKYNGNPIRPNQYVQLDYALENGATILGTAAALTMTSWARKRFKPKERFTKEQLERVRLITSTGSILPKKGFHILHDIFPNAKIASVTGGTDSLSVNAGGRPDAPTIAGQIDSWQLGVKGSVLNEHGQEVDVGEVGEMAFKQPLLSFAKRLLADEDGASLRGSYYLKNDQTLFWGDAMCRNEGGYLTHMGRSGNMLNPFGVAVGVEELYAPLRDMPEILDSMAVGYVRASDNQEIIVLFIESDQVLDEDLNNAIRNKILEDSRKEAVPNKIYQLHKIPRTPTGKIPEVIAKNVLATGTLPHNASDYDRESGQALLEQINKIGDQLRARYKAV
ncbi:MAG: AMP-binding protein [Pseudomonadota bacterium]